MHKLDKHVDTTSIIDKHLKAYRYDIGLYKRLKELDLIIITDEELERGRLEFEAELLYEPTAFARVLANSGLYDTNNILDNLVQKVRMASVNSFKMNPVDLRYLPSSMLPIYVYKTGGSEDYFTEYKGSYYEVISSGLDNNKEFTLLLKGVMSTRPEVFSNYPSCWSTYQVFQELKSSRKLALQHNEEGSICQGKEFVKVQFFYDTIVGEVEQLFFNSEKQQFAVVTPHFYFTYKLGYLKPSKLEVMPRYFIEGREATLSKLKGIWAKGDSCYSLNPLLLKFLPYGKEV